MGSYPEKRIVLVGNDVFNDDSRLNRRMIRRSVSNQSCWDFKKTEKNVAAAEKVVIAIDEDAYYDYRMFLNGKCSYVDLNGDRYDEVDKSSGGRANICTADKSAEASDVFMDPEYKLFLDTNVGKSSGGVSNKCAADENAEASDVFVDPEYKLYLDTNASKSSGGVANQCAAEENAEASDVFIDPEYKLFLDNSTVRNQDILFCIGNEVIAYGQIDNDGETSCKKRTCDSRTIDTEARSSMAVEVTCGESVVGLFKKVRYSQDEKNQSDAEVLESNKREKNSGVKLDDSRPQCDLGSSVVVNGRNKESRTNHCKMENNESDAEVTILEWDPSSGGECTPFVPSKSYEEFLDDYKIPNSGRKVSFEYMEELIEYLKKPYGTNEYFQLMEEVSRRKLVERNMDLRSGTKPFKTQLMGKSYLDLHKGLRLKINQAKPDRPKVLNILRGFFFWLQNITREGAFKPWKDPSILDIRPHGQIF